MLADKLAHHRDHFLEDFPAFLNEEFIRMRVVLRIGAFAVAAFAMVEEPEIVADIVGKFCQQFRSENLPGVAGGRAVGALQDDRRGHVAEYEMAVAVAKIEVRGADFRIDDEDAPRAGANEPETGFNAESRRRTGDIHEAGGRIAVYANNIPEWVLLELGCALAGVTLVTVNPAYQKRELKFVLEQSRAEAVYYVADFRGNPMVSASGGAPSVTATA